MKKMIFILLALAGLSGCATIVKGSSQTMNISTSNGKQANVVVTGKSGTIPTLIPQALSVEKSAGDIVINVTEAECVLPSTTIVKSRLNPWFWGNFIFGGLLGSTTDVATGSAWEYDSNIMVNVVPKDGCKQ